MAKIFTLSSRVLCGACCALLLCGAAATLSLDVPAARAQNANANSAQPPKKKKLPAGAKGFEQYAGRDASDKLVTGGATRGIGDQAADAMKRGNEAFEAARAAEDAGQMPESNKQYGIAVAAYKEAARLRPDLFRAHFLLGGALEGLGQYQEAAAAYKAAVPLQIDPTTDAPSEVWIAYYNLGNAFANAGQHKEAVGAYKEIISRQPALAMPYYNMGLSYVALGQHADAVKAFTDAVKAFQDTAARVPGYKNPTFELAYYNLGLTHSKLEQYAEAAVDFKQALALDPNHAEARYNLGLVYYMMDNRPGLIEQQKALQAVKPELARELAKLMSQ